MIKQLRQKHSQQLADVQAQLDEYHDSISSFNILEDPNFKVEATEAQLSLSSLNEKLTTLNLNLQHLNELWVIKGLIVEIEHAEINVADVSELEYLVNNLQKLTTKVNALSNNLVIKLELKTKVTEFEEKIKAIFDQLFHGFLPGDAIYDETVLNNEFNEFIILAEATPFENNIKHRLLRHKMKWEALLSQLSADKLLRLASDSGKHSLSFEPAANSVDNVFVSALNFVLFINLFRTSTLKQFFGNKLSNVLIEVVSSNITELINSNNEQLIEVMNMANNTNWNLSLDLNKEKFNAKLNVIYNNWLVDKFIDKIRQAFRTIDLRKLKEIKLQEDTSRVSNLEKQLDHVERKMDQQWSPKGTSEPKQDDGRDEEDGWDDGWQDQWDSSKKDTVEPVPIVEAVHDLPAEEEDGWDEDWNEWDDDDGKVAEVAEVAQISQVADSKTGIEASATPTIHSPEPTKLTSAKISTLPDSLLEIINDFQIESTEDIGILVSTILALSTQSYPSIHESFLHYNDLYYLYKNIMSEHLNKYANKLLRQLKHEKSNELVGILIKLQLTDESNNVAVYQALDEWFNKLDGTSLKATNFHQFKELVTSAIELVNSWVCNMVLSTADITELVSGKLTNIIDNFNLIFTKNLKAVNEEALPSQNRVSNFRFLINNHLVDIIERFYQGEFYDLSTNELIMVIERTFIKSELRDNYINEIIEFRTVN